MNNKIIEKIVAKIGIPNIIELLVDRISFGELSSLLLKTFELKTAKKNYRDILKEFQSNRFVKPSDINPIIQRKLELAIFSLLPGEFELIDLSPLAPLGTTSVLTTNHQNNVVSAIKNVEVAADTTNILALECAKRRNELLKKDSKSLEPVKLCAGQRLTRTQLFESEFFSAHFNVIALCSAWKAEGNDGLEGSNLAEHIKIHVSILEKIVYKNELKCINVKFFNYAGYDNSDLIERIKALFCNKDHICFKVENNSEFGKNYYSRLRFVVSLTAKNNEEYDYIDGGFTDWTRKLLNNKKEKLLTSGVGTDFLLRTVKTKAKAGT
ncbi:MAG: hypothetical protein PVH88_10315 [Ignavibacteria bacterium]|jgi:hypothetical protein